jgi:hypothetical protein
MPSVEMALKGGSRTSLKISRLKVIAADFGGLAFPWLAHGLTLDPEI